MSIAEKTMGTSLTKTSGTPLIIADLTSIGEIGVQSEEIDTTTLDSPDGYREFIASLKDAGEISLAGMVKSEDAMESLLALADAQSVEDFEIEFLSGSTWAFSGFVKSFKEGESTVDGVRTFTSAIRISGKPVYTAAEVSA